MSASLLTTVRMLLRFGLPLLGIVVVGRAIVLSIGGEISKPQFALGVLLMAAGFSARLVPKPALPKPALPKPRSPKPARTERPSAEGSS